MTRGFLGPTKNARNPSLRGDLSPHNDEYSVNFLPKFTPFYLNLSSNKARCQKAQGYAERDGKDAGQQKGVIKDVFADASRARVVHLHRAKQRGVGGQHEKRAHSSEASHEHIGVARVFRAYGERGNHDRHDGFGGCGLRVKQGASKEKRHRKQHGILLHEG